MSNRLLRVNELLKREISAYLRKHYSSEAVAITITSVEITGDLREAKIYYAVAGTEAETIRLGKWLRSILGEVRSTVAKNVVIRHIPLLTFVHDDSAPRTLRVETLLAEIDHKEGKA